MHWLSLLDDISENNDDFILLELYVWLWVNDLHNRVLGDWWPRQGNHPSRHMLARPCTIQRRHDGVLPDGLLLIERRSPESSCDAGEEGRGQIQDAIASTNEYFHEVMGGSWSLSAEGYYRLSNRVAWAWRLAHLGIPVVLYYEGYQMGNHEEVVASDWWGRWLDIDNVQGTTTRLLLLPQDYSSAPAVEETRRRLSLR